MTPLEILTEYHAHLYDDLYSQGKLEGLAEDDDFDLESVLDAMNDDAINEPADDISADQWDDIIDES